MVPRYILVIGAPHSGKLRLVQGLLAPDSKELSDVRIGENSHGGLIIPHAVDTTYFSVKIKLLVDEFPDTRSTACADKPMQLREWVTEFIGPECSDLHEVLEGVILCVDMIDGPRTIESFMEAIIPVKELLCNEGNEKFFAVAATLHNKPDKPDLEIEDIVISCGVEFVDMRKSGYNEFKEKIGIDRIRELMETHPWPDMQLKHEYEKNKNTKARQMTTPLLSQSQRDDSAPSLGMDRDQSLDEGLEHVFHKLKLAKARADNMSEAEKEKYIQDVIDEVIDFI